MRIEWAENNIQDAEDNMPRVGKVINNTNAIFNTNGLSSTINNTDIKFYISGSSAAIKNTNVKLDVGSLSCTKIVQKEANLYESNLF